MRCPRNHGVGAEMEKAGAAWSTAARPLALLASRSVPQIGGREVPPSFNWIMRDAAQFSRPRPVTARGLHDPRQQTPKAPMRERFSDVARPTGVAALPPPPRKLPVLNGRLHDPARTSPQTHFWGSRPPISAKSIYRIASSIRKITVIKKISTSKRLNLQFEENVSSHLFTFASEHRSISSGLGWAARRR